MVKCKVITQFYDNVEGMSRKKGEEFECLPERADYLNGNNESKLKVVDIIEVKPDKKETTIKETAEEKPKKKGRKKIDTAE